jgi:protein-L-isoaspartate O-methyltransferase
MLCFPVQSATAALPYVKTRNLTLYRRHQHSGFGVIRSTQVEAAFRDVDRAHFCPRNLVDMAYSDQPLREGDIHLSAPHMYGAIVEQLDLTGSTSTALEHNEEDDAHGATSMSFLNVGSGTGYLSCIVARLLSKSSVLYGIELQRDVLDHCLASMARWKAAIMTATATTTTTTTTTTTKVVALPHMEFVHGNGLHIDATRGESIVGYDRIYVGSSIDQRAVAKLTSMLRLGGILIAPGTYLFC